MVSMGSIKSGRVSFTAAAHTELDPASGPGGGQRGPSPVCKELPRPMGDTTGKIGVNGGTGRAF